MIQSDKNLEMNSKNESTVDVSRWYGSDSHESKCIHKPTGSSMIARGAFGEISIAIVTGKERWRFAAVKTVLQPSSATNSSRTTTTTTTDDKHVWSSSLSPVLVEAPSRTALSPETFYEITALRLLNPHPNIAKLLAVYNPSKSSSGASSMMMSGRSLCLAFEYCPSDLFTSLEWRRRTLMPLLPFNVIAGIVFDLFSALQHCHTNGVLHLDVKPGNLLITTSGYIQLCDFGLARPYEPQPPNNSDGNKQDEEETRGLCTLFYRPPELLLGGSANSPAIDNFSAGLVIGELVTGFPVFRGGNVLGQLATIFELLGTPQETTWPAVKNLPDYGKLQFSPKPQQPLETILPRAKESPKLLELLQNLIVLNPSQRFSAAQVLQHDWLSQTYSNNNNNNNKNNNPCSRRDMQRELIPINLREPIILSNPNLDLTLASKKALEVASTKRTFLANLHKWKDFKKSESSQSSLQSHCAQLCPNLRNSQSHDIVSD